MLQELLVNLLQVSLEVRVGGNVPACGLGGERYEIAGAIDGV